MNEITKSKVNTIMNSMEKTLVYLYSRWQDEKKHEDFGDYIEKMKKEFETTKVSEKISNAVFVKGYKRPFGFSFDFEGWFVVMSFNSGSFNWKAKTIHWITSDSI